MKNERVINEGMKNERVINEGMEELKNVGIEELPECLNWVKKAESIQFLLLASQIRRGLRENCQTYC